LTGRGRGAGAPEALAEPGDANAASVRDQQRLPSRPRSPRSSRPWAVRPRRPRCHSAQAAAHLISPFTAGAPVCRGRHRAADRALRARTAPYRPPPRGRGRRPGLRTAVGYPVWRGRVRCGPAPGTWLHVDATLPTAEAFSREKGLGEGIVTARDGKAVVAARPSRSGTPRRWRLQAPGGRSSWGENRLDTDIEGEVRGRADQHAVITGHPAGPTPCSRRRTGGHLLVRTAGCLEQHPRWSQHGDQFP